MARRLLMFCLLWLAADSAFGLDRVVFRQDDKELRLFGQVLVKAADGGLLLQTPDGRLWNIEPKFLIEHQTTSEPFKFATSAELSKQLLDELPKGFETYSTAHYIICYNTSKAYAQWAGALFERLYSGFTNFWTRKGFKLHDADTPLVAFVFADKQTYADFCKPELGENSLNIIGYYSLKTNRITMYDLTGVESLRQPGDKRGSPQQINLMLSRPESEAMVATVIHEATHQIAFNCGLQTRFADIPLWVSEGLAVFFETPDLKNNNGWSTIGAVNYGRLTKFRENQPARSERSLESLVMDDKRFRDPRQALDAYAEAWALNYYLFRQKGDAYVAYLKMLSEKDPLVWDTPEERLKQFKAAFGGDLPKFDAEFTRQMLKVK